MRAVAARLEVRSPRLVMRTATEPELRASVGEPSGLSAAVGCEVAPGWPPRHWEAPAVEWLIARMREHPAEVFWRAWFLFIAEADHERLAGTIGFKGPPGSMPDSDGVVEIGYTVVPSHWRRGIASEAAAAMIRWAAGDERVRTLRAHTLSGDPASSGVLLKNGFVRVATLNDPDDGMVDRFERGVEGLRS